MISLIGPRCSGLLILDTDLGENLADREVSDEQAATYFFR
ncbi:hypothetical protein SAMN05216409_1363, partial [Pseudomonas lutea]